MPQLIIDQEALQLIAAEVAGQPVYAGPTGGLLAPGVIDLMEDDGPGDRWQPGDERTRHLVLAAEACRDLALHAQGFEESAQRRRVAKAMTVPLCSLMEIVAKLLKDFNAPAFRSVRERWPRADQQVYAQASKRLKKHKLGPVRQVRNKKGAHLDHTAIGDPSLKLPLDDLLLAMGDSVVLAILASNHGTDASAFVWIRCVGRSDDGSFLAVETMVQYPMCVQLLTDVNGKVVGVARVSLAEDPRHEVQKPILEAARVYNRMVTLAGSTLPSIYIVPTEELLASEQEALRRQDE